MNSKHQSHLVASNRSNLLAVIRKKANNSLKEKYAIDDNFYNSLLINLIIYNDKAHIVTLFKDFLIIDDRSEFLKRYYAAEESAVRLPKFFEYYDTYSKLYPNYTVILEGKYLYHNIQKKQKMINIQEEMEYEALNEKKRGFSDDVFSTDVYDSIINDRNNEDLDAIFNASEKSIDYTKRLNEIIIEIERNDQATNCNLNNSGNNTSVRQQPVLANSVSAKKKLMISSLLGRNKALNNSSLYGSDYCNSTRYNCKNSNSTSNRISNSLNSQSQIQAQVPLTDRPSSKKQTSTSRGGNSSSKAHNVIKQPVQSNQSNKTKIIANYSNTVFNSNMSQIKKQAQGESSCLPLSQLQNRRKMWSDSIFTKQQKKDCDRIEHEKITTPPKYTNNFIYIINQNPKYTTNVAFYDNSILRAASKKATSKPTNRKNEAMTSSAQSQALSNQQTIAVASASTSKPKRNQMKPIEKPAAKTRNNTNQLINNYMIKTSRELKHKEQLNLLRTSSQLTISQNQKDYFYSTKYQSKRTSLKGEPTSRNKSTRDKAGSLTQRNDSISKRVSANISNTGTYIPKKKKGVKGMKGIQIHNFSKVFSLNFSQITSERKKKI